MEIKTDFPTCGQKQMMGHLKSRGRRVQQERVREVMRRVDPAGSIYHEMPSYIESPTIYTLYQHQVLCGTLMATTS